MYTTAQLNLRRNLRMRETASSVYSHSIDNYEIRRILESIKFDNSHLFNYPYLPVSHLPRIKHIVDLWYLKKNNQYQGHLLLDHVLQSLNIAIYVAKNKQDSELEIIALCLRGEVFANEGDTQSAQKDLNSLFQIIHNQIVPARVYFESRISKLQSQIAALPHTTHIAYDLPSTEIDMTTFLKEVKIQQLHADIAEADIVHKNEEKNFQDFSQFQNRYSPALFKQDRETQTDLLLGETPSITDSYMKSVV